MELVLSELLNLVHYTGKPFPSWGRFLVPDAAYSVLAIEKDTGGLRYTDIWRTAEISLTARGEKTGVQAPGYSGHNYGFSLDLDLNGSMARRRADYPHLRDLMASYGWYCHRRDGLGGSESWHFNFLGVGSKSDRYLSVTDKHSPATWDKAVELRITEAYGTDFELSRIAIQTKLQQLKFYQGELDGEFGPQTKQAILNFQNQWKLSSTGLADDAFKRTLAFVTATKNVVPATEGDGWNKKYPTS